MGKEHIGWWFLLRMVNKMDLSKKVPWLMIMVPVKQTRCPGYTPFQRSAHAHTHMHIYIYAYYIDICIYIHSIIPNQITHINSRIVYTHYIHVVLHIYIYYIYNYIYIILYIHSYPNDNHRLLQQWMEWSSFDAIQKDLRRLRNVGVAREKLTKVKKVTGFRKKNINLWRFI